MLCRSTPVSVITPKTVIRANWGKESKGEELMYIAPIRNKVITFFTANGGFFVSSYASISREYGSE